MFNLPKYSLSHTKLVYFVLAVMLIGGVIAFDKLAKKEDAPFVIKTAVLMCYYPGATPEEESGRASFREGVCDIV